MLVYKSIFTVTETLFIFLALMAIWSDKKKGERDTSFLITIIFVLVSSLGCIVGMWM